MKNYTVDEESLLELIESKIHLNALKDIGVDQWLGYGYALINTQMEGFDSYEEAAREYIKIWKEVE